MGNFNSDRADIFSLNECGIEEMSEIEKIIAKTPHFREEYGLIIRARPNEIIRKPNVATLGRRDHWKILSI